MPGENDNMRGSNAGAIAWLTQLTPGGIVPKEWRAVTINGPLSITQNNGPYKLHLIVSSGFGVISWPPNGAVTFRWDKKTFKTYNIEGGLTGGGPSATTTPLKQITDTIGNAASSVPEFLGKISSAALWKRIGIGAVGVVIILIGLVFIVKKGVME